MKTRRCNYPQCGALFEIVWGPGSLANKRLYCSPGCRIAYRKEKNRAVSKANGWYNERKKKRNKETKGNQCQYPHCQVDDKHHIESWNAPALICPSCYRQKDRVGSCSRCGGPRYHRPNCKSLYCPNCSPLLAQAGEVSVTLVCLATGRERQVVRKLHWRLPDGTKLADVQDEGYAVIDVEPKYWAGCRV